MNGANPRFHFVLDACVTRWGDIASLAEPDIAREPRRFVGGRNSWIAQSFVRLRDAIASRGWSATAGPGFPDGAICIAHRDDVNRFTSAAHRAFLVVVRADRAPVHACDVAIVQNGLERARHERFVPLWPQPGLLARDAARGTRIERIAYHGRTRSAPSWFADPAFRGALARRRVFFDVEGRDWEDYRDVDIAIATRSELKHVLAQKPATKLYNAWLAERRLDGRRAWFFCAMARQKARSRMHRAICALETCALASSVSVGRIAATWAALSRRAGEARALLWRKPPRGSAAAG